MEQKNFAIVALVCALAIMAVGYSLLAQNLTINGTANITSTWDVQITGITEGEATGGATNKTPASFTGTTATFDVEEVDVECLDGTIQSYYVYKNGASTISNYNITFKI